MDKLLEGPQTVFEIGGLQVTETIISMWIVSVVIIIIAAYFRSKVLSEKPSRAKDFAEFIVESINNMVRTNMGDNKVGFAPYMGFLLIFIGIANISGLFGLFPPTADINTTVTLALMTFVLIHYYGLKEKGFEHIKGLGSPIILFLPLNVISELSKPVSLAFRLFGNVFAGTIILALIYGALGNLAIGIPVIGHLYFDLFAGLLQSFIFVMLTMVFITLAMESEAD
ncbi:F0F1 ATP synthase subunit A [Proteinivorax hydrogeniformans]|uniref:ATP synthase subunit a n=1 Tax=Proteinivorax hydrogeniformans TaxID=1826727 RepID=A0AAU8HXE7_9FIRM